MQKKLAIKNLSVSYLTDKSHAFEIFKDVSFSVNSGDVFALFGSNGCGKSTLLKTIAGNVAPDNGSILFPKKCSTISTLPQDYRESFFNWTSLLGNILLTLPRPFKDRAENVAHIYSTAKDLGISLDFSLKPRQCSGGMLQQAALVRLFASRPNIILADEPFSALDISISSDLRSSFCKMVKDRGIFAIVVLHNLEDIVEVADSVLAIQSVPYTTAEHEGYSTAQIIINEQKRRRGLCRKLTFVEHARQVLIKPNNKS